MRITVGTKTGLAHVHGDATIEWLLKGDVRVCDGHWAIVDDRQVASVDEARIVARTPLSLKCLASTPSGVLLGSAEARLFELAPGGSEPRAIDSFDRIPTRDEWYTPWGDPPDTRSITMADDGAALVNVHVGGVWRSSSVEGPWSEVIPVDDDTHQVLAGGGTIAVAAAVGYGQSDDGGHTFSWTTDGLHAAYCRGVAITDDVVLVSASTGPFTRHGAVYLRPLEGGAPFVRCDQGCPVVPRQCGLVPTGRERVGGRHRYRRRPAVRVGRRRVVLGPPRRRPRCRPVGRDRLSADAAAQIFCAAGEARNERRPKDL